MPLDLDALRTRLGLAPDADEDAINAALTETPPPGPGPNGDDPVPPEPDPDPERVPVAAGADLTVTVSREQWSETQARLATLEESHAERQARELREQRDGLVAAATMDGRISPAERDRWRAALDEAPKATADLIGALTPNKIPVHARGGEQAEGGTSLAEGEGTGLFPELDRQEA